MTDSSKPPAFQLPALSTVPDISAVIAAITNEKQAANDKKKVPKDINYNEITLESFIIKKDGVADNFKDWLASNAFQDMNNTEFGAYRRLLLRCGSAYYQGFFPFDIHNIREIWDVTEARFYKLWNTIGPRFRFAKHEEKLYIYNPRQFKELINLHINAMHGRKGGETTQQRQQQPSAHEFKDSPYYDKAAFIKAMQSDPDFANVDHAHYYEKVKAWAGAAKDQPLRGNWLEQGKVFILNSAEKNALHVKSGIKPTVKKQMQVNLVNRRKDFKM